jgi:hypothetical protein
MEPPRLTLLQGGRAAEKPAGGKLTGARERGDLIYRADYSSWWCLPPPRRQRRRQVKVWQSKRGGLATPTVE